MNVHPKNGNLYTRAQALEEQRRKRGRRRLATWGAFLLLGLLFGAIYATGFATSGGTSPSPAVATPNNNEPAVNADTSALAGLIRSSNDLTYNWTGRWGEISSAVLYEVDLSSYRTTDLFFVEVVLTNVPAGFSDLQIQYRLAAHRADGTDGCATTDLNDTNSVSSNYRVMIFDAEDAQVTFSGLDGLPGADKYCIGVFDYSSPAPGSGKDEAGTFIRKSVAGSDILGIVEPEFVGTLNRML